MKLRDRVVRIVRDATGADQATAAAHVEQAGGDARLAILMIRFGIGKARALEALQQSNDHFGDAVQWLEKESLA